MARPAAIVTAASSGVRHATALALARTGYDGTEKQTARLTYQPRGSGLSAGMARICVETFS